MLPLLQEQQGTGTSTAEERVIGAGLKAIQKNEDGAAVIDLFHMYAVTQEDFGHPMAVIELLWRSCCASESEQQESSLTTRLKVRQWTQLLVDHSLLLGSSSDGIHLHDIVLSYLRKRLTVEEMRDLHRSVLRGMMSASRDRKKTTGQGLQGTGGWVAMAPRESNHAITFVCAVPTRPLGSTTQAFAGEEVDWVSNPHALFGYNTLLDSYTILTY